MLTGFSRLPEATKAVAHLYSPSLPAVLSPFAVFGPNSLPFLLI